MILQTIISISTIVSMWLIGSTSPRGWLLTLVNQALWLGFIIQTQAWGLIPLNIAMWVVSIRGYLRCRKESYIVGPRYRIPRRMDKAKQQASEDSNEGLKTYDIDIAEEFRKLHKEDDHAL